MWKASVIDHTTFPGDVRARVVVTAYPPFPHTKLPTSTSGMNCICITYNNFMHDMILLNLGLKFLLS